MCHGMIVGVVVGVLVGDIVRLGENRESKAGCEEPLGMPHGEGSAGRWGLSGSEYAMKRGEMLSRCEKVAYCCSLQVRLMGSAKSREQM